MNKYSFDRLDDGYVNLYEQGIFVRCFEKIYLKDFDKYMKHILQIKYYGRYVDDFYIIHNDKKYLKTLIPKITWYLKQNLELNE